MKAIIITGSRDWTEYTPIHEVIAALPLDTIVIHGACATGADAIAHDLIRTHPEQCTPVPMPAPWSQHGRAAGPMRNRCMLTVLQCLSWCGYDVEVHAYPLPQSRGTRHMVRIARDAGIEVIEHCPVK